MTSDLHLDVITDEASLLSLQPHWEALHQRSAVRTPFRTWDWAWLWWKHFGDRCKLRVGVLRDSTHTPVAIAPMIIGRENAGPRSRLRHLTLLGGIGEVASEGLDFLAPRGQEAALLPQFTPLFKNLRHQWDIVDLPYIHADSPALEAVQSLLSSIGAAGQRSDPQSAHVLELPETWDALMASFSRNRRSDIRSKWKKLMQAGGRTISGGRELTGADAMEQLIAVHRMRFAEAESTFLAPRALAFHRDLIAKWTPAGRIMISLLELNGSVIAGRYGHVFDDRYWDYQSGYDPVHSALSVGNLNLAWAVQSAIGLGLREYDHLAGDQTYKQGWSTRTRQFLHLESMNRMSPMAALFRLTRALKRLITASREETNPAPPPDSSAPLSKPDHAAA